MNYENGDPKTRSLRTVHGYAISAKRYCLLENDRIVEVKGHGLGYLMSPASKDEPDWMQTAWQYVLRFDQVLGNGSDPAWLDYPAMMKIPVSSPAVLGRLKSFVKPYDFVLAPILLSDKLETGGPSVHRIQACIERCLRYNPDPKHISTSYIERQNLPMRMHMRRFTRLTNGFSKKVENHAHSVALHYMFYNFCRIHQTLKVTPAMEAGLTDHAWSLEELVALMPKPIVSDSQIERNLLLKALGQTNLTV